MKKKKKSSETSSSSFFRQQHVDMMGPNMLELSAKYYLRGEEWWPTYTVAGVCRKDTETTSVWFYYKNGKPQRNSFINKSNTTISEEWVKLIWRSHCSSGHLIFKVFFSSYLLFFLKEISGYIQPKAGAVYHGKILILLWPEKDRHSLTQAPHPLPPHHTHPRLYSINLSERCKILEG